MQTPAARAAEALARLREEHPLIHHITNQVVMNDTANLTLHLGALPVMAHAPEEVGDMVSVAGALVLNTGTLTTETIATMLIAGRRANALGIPIVLDPVGAGANRFRTEMNARLLSELRIAVVRGNAGEIATLAGAGGRVKGVESVGAVENPAAVARELARRCGAVVAITGQRDLISDGRRTLAVDNGHRWLTTLTGTGCMATTAVACFAAVERELPLAVAAALAAYGLAAEQAAPQASGPASFKVAFLDRVYLLTPEQLAQGARIVELEEAG